MTKTLFERLQNVSSEEDVKDIYIDVLGLKRTQKNLIDIQTREIEKRRANRQRSKEQ